MTLMEPVELLDELALESLWSPRTDLTPFEEVCAMLDRIVAREGADYVYTRGPDDDCRYLDLIKGSVRWPEHGNYETLIVDQAIFKPSCLVGQMVFEMQDTNSLALLWMSNNVDGVSDISSFLPSSWVRDNCLMKCLQHLQNQQDEEVSWGAAVAEFKDVYPKVVAYVAAGGELDDYPW
jgi:hypothetical protein